MSQATTPRFLTQVRARHFSLVCITCAAQSLLRLFPKRLLGRIFACMLYKYSCDYCMSFSYPRGTCDATMATVPELRCALQSWQSASSMSTQLTPGARPRWQWRPCSPPRGRLRLLRAPPRTPLGPASVQAAAQHWWPSRLLYDVLALPLTLSLIRS